MSQLSMVEIAKVAYRAGFRGDDLRTAVAVAWAESSGSPRANSGFPGEDSRGLWQINSVHFGQYDESRLYQPDYNAKAAHDIWLESKRAGHGGWYPWSTWRFGQYKQYLDDATRAVRRADLGTGSGGGSGGTGGHGHRGGQGSHRVGSPRPWRLPRHAGAIKADPVKLQALAEQLTGHLATVESVFHRCDRELDQLGRVDVAGDRLEHQLRRRLHHAIEDWDGLRRLPYLMTRDVGYVVEVKRRVEHADRGGAKRTVEGLIGTLAGRSAGTRRRTAALLRELYRPHRHAQPPHRHHGSSGLAGVDLGRAWAGTKSIFVQFVTPFMRRRGLRPGSQKRDYDTVAGPGVSDHYVGATNAYATDYPTYRGEDEARKLARAMGITDWQPNSYANHDVAVDGVRFRVQILWGAGIDHGDHVHVGMRRL